MQEKFGRDLDELELLVKGALQCVKDTDIHENVEPVDLDLLLQHIAEPYLADGRVEVVGRAAEPYPGKPLALKRCIGNLLDNALKYGERARLSLEDGPEAVVLHVDDDGPGVPEQRLEQIFEPRFRLSPRGQGLRAGPGHRAQHRAHPWRRSQFAEPSRGRPAGQPALATPGAGVMGWPVGPLNEAGRHEVLPCSAAAADRGGAGAMAVFARASIARAEVSSAEGSRAVHRRFRLP